MEKGLRIVAFGDSITSGCHPYLSEVLEKQYPDHGLCVLNSGINGETSYDGCRRLKSVIKEKPQVVILGFGMNDFLQNAQLEAYRQNLEKIIAALQVKDIRVIINTINPICPPDGEEEDLGVDSYNSVIFKLAEKFGLVVNDIGAFWKRELAAIHDALVYEGCDFIHPNHIGYRLTAQRLAVLIPRSMTRIVWQFNGENAECNYACPYCYQPAHYHHGHHFIGDQATWRSAFRKAFGIRRLNFYLSFGEPSLAEAFYDVIGMIESEPRWKVVILTNLSQNLKPLYEMEITREGRLFVVASFHPSMVRLNAFIEQILQARRYGVEIPVVYVMWPPQIRDFDERYFPAFQANHIPVHVRRFRGMYQGKAYPQSYTWQQVKTMAKYMDNLTIRYMLCDRISSGKESFAGMSYLGVSNDGGLWVCPDWAGDRPMGNVLRGDAAPFSGPAILGGNFSDGTTDGIANLLEVGMEELDDNHILSFCTQTGFDLSSETIGYPNFQTDFDDPEVQTRLGLNALFRKDTFVVMGEAS